MPGPPPERPARTDSVADDTVGLHDSAEFRRVLVVDGEPRSQRAIVDTLADAGFVVDAADCGADALDCLARSRFDAAVVAHRLRDIDALGFMERMPGPSVPLVVISGEGDEAEAVRLMKRGVREYLVKSRDAIETLPVAVRHVIHEERLARRARAAEQRYRTLFEHVGDAIFIHDVRGRLLDVNDAACRLLGHPRDALLSRSLGELAHPRADADDGECILERMRSLDENERLAFDTCFVRADGTSVPVGVISTRKGLDGDALVFSSVRDLSERIRHEEELARATADWEQTFHAITDPLALADGDGRVIRANRAMLERVGLTPEEIRGRSAPQLLGTATLLHDDGVDRFREPGTWEAELPELGGHYQVTVFPRGGADGTPRKVLFYCKDVTNERRLRARMLQTEKLSSLGQLVSGVAHELNNPLAAVQGLAELLLEDLEETGAGDIEDVRNILEQSQRASGIVRNLLQFSRRSHLKGELFDLNTAVRAAAGLLRYRLSSREIELVLALADDLPPLFGVLQQVEQVLVNLLLNAYEALVDTGRGGRLRVATRVADDGPLEVIVEDNGPGVPAEHVNHLFEPFFTTKEVGRGTGLGLSVSYGLVQEQGGDIHLDTSYTDGARFVVRLPVASEARRDALPAVIDDEDVSTGTVLLVDDEPEWAEAMREALATRGFRATAETDPDRALAWLAEEPVDLVICDASVRVAEDEGGGDGAAAQPFHDAVCARYPELQERVCLLLRGGDAAPGGLEDAWPVLRKPFSTDRLYDWAHRNLQRSRERS